MEVVEEEEAEAEVAAVGRVAAWVVVWPFIGQIRV